jgi:hypothetical protein
MTDLQREAREAAKAAYPPGSGRLGHGIFNGEPAREGFRERYWFEKGYLAAAAPRDEEMRQLRLLAEEQLTTLRKLKAEILSDTRDKEIERLKAELAKTKLPIWMLREEHEQEVAALRGELADWEESARKAAGERCEDEIHCCCVPYLRVEIDRLRARVDELELEVEITAREALDRIAELEEWKSTVPIEDLKELNEWELGFEYPCEAAASISDWLSGQIPLPERKA